MTTPKLVRQAPWALLLLIGGIAIAQSVANEGRDIPYVGYLEEDGFPVSGQRAFRVELFVSDAAPTACDAQQFDTVDVSTGRFQIELSDIPDLCLASGELFVELSVGPDSGSFTALATGTGQRVRIGAVPFAAASPKSAPFLVEDDARVAGRLAVERGVISRGGSVTAVEDLGLYSQVASNWVRIVTNDGPVRFFSDGGGGSTINLSIETNGDLEARGDLYTGNAFVGDTGWGAQFATFSHVSRIGQGTYAFGQEQDGSRTIVNTSTTGVISFRSGNADRMIMSADGDLSTSGTVSSSCPTNMVDRGGYCIDYAMRGSNARGVTWDAAAANCQAAGVRLCTPQEVSTAAKSFAIQTHAIAAGNYWAWADSFCGDDRPAHVQLNTDEGGAPLGVVHCNGCCGQSSSNAFVGALCCADRRLSGP